MRFAALGASAKSPCQEVARAGAGLLVWVTPEEKNAAGSVFVAAGKVVVAVTSTLVAAVAHTAAAVPVGSSHLDETAMPVRPVTVAGIAVTAGCVVMVAEVVAITLLAGQKSLSLPELVVSLLRSPSAELELYPLLDKGL